MSVPSPLPRVLRFGIYQCDLRSRELHKNGIRVKISDQPFKVLAVLLEHPGEVVTRQQLREKLWPAETFVGFEDSLNTAVNKLRAALDDQAENPRFIETLPRRGYRFIAPIEPILATGASAAAESGTHSPDSLQAQKEHSSQREFQDSDAPFSSPRGKAALEGRKWASSTSPDARDSHRHRSRSRSSWAIRAGVAIATVAIAFALWWFNPLPPPQIIRTDQVSFDARVDTPAKPVSDGQHVYYMERAGDHWNLVQASFPAGESRALSVPGRSAMAFDLSPDFSNLLVATFEKRDGQTQLWILPLQGGPPKPLGDRDVGTAVFSSDGKQIAYAIGATLSVMSPDGSNARKLAGLPAPPFWLAWSPDDSVLRFTMGGSGGTPGNQLWEISSNGRNLHPVLPNWSHPASECCGSWTADGRYFIFTSVHNGHTNLWALRDRASFWRRSPRGPFQLTSGPDWPQDGTAARAGNLIFFYNGVWRQDLQRFDLKTGQFSAAFPQLEVSTPSFSRDGNWVAYVDSVHHNLLSSRPDGTDRIQLAAAGLHPQFPRWSPDGKWLVFGTGIQGQPAQPYVVSSDGAELRPLLTSATDLRDADWAPGSDKLVVSRALGPSQSDGRELLIVDFPSRVAQPVPDSENLAMSRWSPDGRYIAATTEDQSQLKLFDVSSNQWRVIARGEGLGIAVWSPDGRSLYFQDILAPGEPLMRYDIANQRSETVVDFSSILKSGISRCALYSITPDGSPVIGFSRGAYDLFSAEVSLP
jgi:Tol biopolymer transport system component/DNA-binding winged helix-turn-helix (wHTH) protein